MMQISDVISELETLAPPLLAEDFDNVGLLVGDRNSEVKGVLVTLDTTEQVILEAHKKGCNLVVSFHPIIFKGLKSLTGKNYVERVVISAIQKNIAIYAIHTNLDNIWEGVNHKISEVLGLKNLKGFIPKTNSLYKLTTYVPTDHVEKVRTAMFEKGAGSLGNYDSCSFNLEGKGTFKPNESADPFVGKKGEVYTENETQVSVVFTADKRFSIESALKKSHPYESVAYEVVKLENTYDRIGIGRIGELEKPLSEKEFLALLKDKFQVPVVRHSELLGKEIKKIAVLGGSGSFGIKQALRHKVDAYVTADLKYHEFFGAENKLLLADVGHFESEQYTIQLLENFLKEKFSNFAVFGAEEKTNPVNYFIG